MPESEISGLRDTLPDLLHSSILFQHLPERDLNMLLVEAELSEFASGHTVVIEGEPADVLFVVVDGELEVFRRAGTRDVPIAIRGRGDIIGEIELLTGEARAGTVRARTSATVVAIPCAVVESVVFANPHALLATLRTVVGRLRDAEANLIQHQKVTALGTMAAGIAHELNNPAAALQRSSAALYETVSAWERQSATLDADEIPLLDGIRAELAARAGQPRWIDPLARDTLEQEVASWLATEGVDGAWRLSPLLVDAGWDPASLGQQISDIDHSHRPSLLAWLATGQQVHTLLHELTTSAATISEIVAGVKSYTRLDESPVQMVDINAGIDQSLVMLRHKLRGITIRRDNATELPLIEANAVELNQVWTNLLDNAADALDGSGEIAIRTALDGDHIVVEVSDTGPGIADDARPRLFEPCFTTKPPGKGLGLGLSISWSIVRRHDGEIQVDSQPGQTNFTVRLPVGEGRRYVETEG